MLVTTCECGVRSVARDERMRYGEKGDIDIVQCGICNDKGETIHAGR